jgi:hypothetical protein
VRAGDTAGGGAAPRVRASADPVATLQEAKRMLDAGLITQHDYDAVKARSLGL